jgi:hypothetical protein
MKRNKNLVKWARTARRKKALKDLQRAYLDKLYLESLTDEQAQKQGAHMFDTKQKRDTELVRIVKFIQECEAWLQKHPSLAPNQMP